MVDLLGRTSMKEYDEYVRNHSHGWVTSLSAWMNVIEESFPHIKAQTLIARDESSRIAAALPLFQVSSPFLGRRLVSVPFATLSDPLLADPGDAEYLARAIVQLVRDTRSRKVEVRINASDAAAWEDAGFSLDSVHVCHSIDLSRPLDEIRGTFHRSCVRQQIAKSEKSGMTVRRLADCAQVLDFYHLYRNTRKGLGLPSMPSGFFTAVCESLWQTGNVDFLFAEWDDKLVAAMMVLKFRDRYSAEAMGWDRMHTHLGPVPFLYWQAIARAHSEGYKVFDFGRTDPANTSLMQFKERWGTTATELRSFVYPASHEEAVAPGDEGGIKSVLRKLAPRLPNAAYNWYSRCAYRNLG